MSLLPGSLKIPAAHRKVSWLILKKLKLEFRLIASFATIAFMSILIVDYLLEYPLFWDTLLPIRMAYFVPSILFIVFYHHPLIQNHFLTAVAINLLWFQFISIQLVFSASLFYEYAMGWFPIIIGIGVFIVWRLRYLLLSILFVISIGLINLYLSWDAPERVEIFINITPIFLMMCAIACVINVLNYRLYSRQFTLLLELNQRERSLRKKNCNYSARITIKRLDTFFC